MILKNQIGEVTVGFCSNKTQWCIKQFWSTSFQLKNKFQCFNKLCSHLILHNIIFYFPRIYQKNSFLVNWRHS